MAELGGYGQFNKYTHTHTHTQCEWHRMTRMTGPDCAVMGNLINTHTRTHTHIHTNETSSGDGIGEDGGGAREAQEILQEL